MIFAVGWIKNNLSPDSLLGRSPWWIGLVLVEGPAQRGVAYQGRLSPGHERCFATGQIVGERRFAFVAVTDTADPTLAAIEPILTKLADGGAASGPVADSLMAGQVALPATAVVRKTALFAPEVSQFGNGLDPARPIVWSWDMTDAGFVFGEVNPQPPPCVYG